MFSFDRDKDDRIMYFKRGLHFYAFGWEWDIGLFYFRRWR
jgi:hypothetical protein